MDLNEYDWREVGIFEVENENGSSVLLPVEVALDRSGGFLIRVDRDDANLDRQCSAQALVDYFMPYGPPFLRDLLEALADLAGYEDVCRLAYARLPAID